MSGIDMIESDFVSDGQCSHANAECAVRVSELVEFSRKPIGTFLQPSLQPFQAL